MIPESSAFGARDRALLTILQHTGLRVGELCGLNVGDPQRRALRAKLVLRPEICRSRTIPLCSKAQLAARLAAVSGEARVLAGGRSSVAGSAWPRSAAGSGSAAPGPGISGLGRYLDGDSAFAVTSFCRAIPGSGRQCAPVAAMLGPSAAEYGGSLHSLRA